MAPTLATLIETEPTMRTPVWLRLRDVALAADAYRSIKVTEGGDSASVISETASLVGGLKAIYDALDALEEELRR